MRVQGYVIHTRPFQDNKVLLDVLTQEQGLIRAVWRRNTKEARVTPGSFLLHELELSGRGELKTARSVEPLESAASLQGNGLYSAFYLHELLERLVPTNLPVEPLFILYQWVIVNLRQGVPIAPLLRRFEVGLFDELGMGINLSCTARGEVLQSTQLYQFHGKFGLRPYLGDQPKVRPMIYLDGATAKGYTAGLWSNRSVLSMAKELHRAWLDAALGGRELKSRDLLPTAEFAGERLWQVPVFRFEESIK